MHSRALPMHSRKLPLVGSAQKRKKNKKKNEVGGCF
jgi:hypothetical protein